MIEVYRNFLTHIKPIKQKNASSECSDASAFNGDTPLESLEFSNLELCQSFLRTSPELRQHKLHGIGHLKETTAIILKQFTYSFHFYFGAVAFETDLRTHNVWRLSREWKMQSAELQVSIGQNRNQLNQQI